VQNGARWRCRAVSACNIGIRQFDSDSWICNAIADAERRGKMKRKEKQYKNRERNIEIEVEESAL
jgi:hypothetical protein